MGIHGFWLWLYERVRMNIHDGDSPFYIADDGGGTTPFGLEKIKHVIAWPEGLYSVIDEEGIELRAQAVSRKRTKGKTEIYGLWHEWFRAIGDKDNITKFDYPAAYQKKDLSEAWSIILCGLAMFIMFLAMSIFCLFPPPEEVEQAVPFAFEGLAIVGGILSLLGLAGAIYGYKRKPYILASVTVDQDNFFVTFQNGNTKTFRVSDIDRYSFHPRIGPGMVIKLTDGTRLDHLERLSYWPILWEKLIVVKDEQTNFGRLGNKYCLRDLKQIRHETSIASWVFLLGVILFYLLVLIFGSALESGPVKRGVGLGLCLLSFLSLLIWAWWVKSKTRVKM